MREQQVYTIIQTTPQDNVGIVPQTGGLRSGSGVNGEIVLREDIPMGHKLALVDLPAGAAVIRYGQVIGYVTTDLPAGSWVNETNLRMPEPPSLEAIRYEPAVLAPQEALTGYHFQGYRNADGSVGTRNILCISESVQCVAGIARHVAERIKKELLPRYPNVDDVVAINHSYGCGVAIDAPAAIIPIRTIQHIARNPNFGNETMVIGLGCEKLRPERLLGGDKADEKSVLYLQDEAFSGFEEMVSGIMDMAEAHLRRLNARRRETCPASELVVGMQCGGSDAFSGITANPVAGYAADLIVRAGGTVMFSEVTEVRDAIHLLVPRAANEKVAKALVEEMAWYDQYLSLGRADRSANTTPGNKKGGLSNIVEKALGSVAKSGSSPIMDVVPPGERVRTKGLNFAATPASDFVCGTLQLAAGMNVHVFMTGRGTPYGLAMVPVIKVSSNSRLSQRWADLIDFDAGPVALGEKTIVDMGWELFRLILEVAGGNKKVATDALGIYNDLALFNPGPLT